MEDRQRRHGMVDDGRLHDELFPSLLTMPGQFRRPSPGPNCRPSYPDPAWMDQRVLGGADRSGDPNKVVELMRRQKVEHQEQRWMEWNNDVFERDEARSSGRREKTRER